MDLYAMGWDQLLLELNGKSLPPGETPKDRIRQRLTIASGTACSGPAGEDATSPDRPRGTAMQHY